jgi:hypothetical protein
LEVNLGGRTYYATFVGGQSFVFTQNRPFSAWLSLAYPVTSSSMKIGSSPLRDFTIGWQLRLPGNNLAL